MLLSYLVNNVNRDFKRPTDKEILDVISVIRRIYPKIENEIRELTQQDIFYNEVICNTTDITNEKRTGHLLQLASIIGKALNSLFLFLFRPS